MVHKMRFFVLEQVGAFATVWLSKKRRAVSPLVFAGAALGLGVAGAIFVGVTEIKTERTEASEKSTDVAAFADALMIRGASFHTDAILIDRPGLREMFVEQRPELLKEFLSGIPMSGLITNQLVKPAKYFDMQFTWLVEQGYVESSDFVSAFTSLEYAYGVTAMVIGAIVFGFLHGKFFQFAAQRPNDWNWIAVQAIVLPIALHGLQRSDLLGIMCNSLLYVAVLRLLRDRRRRPGEAAAGARAGFRTLPART